MNILFLSLLYHPDIVKQVTAKSSTGLQNQINNYQWAVVEGIRANLIAGERLDILNALPVGSYPKEYADLWLPSVQREEGFCEIGSINLPGLKQGQRARAAERAIEKWINASLDNRNILIYTLYLPYLQAICRIKNRHPEVKASVIVTDLPNELGISSGRTGLLKQLERVRGRRSLQLTKAIDGFVLLTRHMSDPLAVGERPFIVMEGLISSSAANEAHNTTDLNIEDCRPAVLYTGTLNRELGIGELLTAFEQMPEYQLWLCGKGDMEAEALEAMAKHDNIHYYGFVSQQEAIALQAKAAALINPRTSQGVFTQYSFPSKTLEYMRSGKPVLCCKLEGIPAEYDDYLHYINPQNVDGIIKSIQTLFLQDENERNAMGESSRSFVLEHKRSNVQAARLLALMRKL